MNINIRTSIAKIKEFQSESDFLYYFEQEDFFLLKDYDSVINNINKINFFIGSNNSGKSRFLRGLFKTDEDCLILMEDTLTFNDLLNRLKLYNVEILEFLDNAEFKEINSFLEKLKIETNFLKENLGSEKLNNITIQKNNVFTLNTQLMLSQFPEINDLAYANYKDFDLKKTVLNLNLLYKNIPKNLKYASNIAKNL